MEKNNLLRKTKNYLRYYTFLPKKRLGQNFTVNSEILEKLVASASLTRDDVVLEIGAGFGFLTNLLSKKCKKVILDFNRFNLKGLERIIGRRVLYQ